MKQRRLDGCIDRFEQVADLIARTPRYKQLAAESGFEPTYVKNVMSKLVRLKRARVIVSRETLLKSLTTDKAFGELLDSAPGRTVTPARSGVVAPSAPTESGPKIP